MKRRHFVTSVLGTGMLASTAKAAQNIKPDAHSGHDDDGISGLLSNATVSFGAWPLGDRLSPPPAGPPPNVHQLIPNEVVIRKGGTVNFIVAGFHQVVVYGPGKRVEGVNFTMLQPTPGVPAGVTFPPIIDDPQLRVFRGFVNFAQPVDRVEVVHFPNRGRHLVICGFSPHFNASEKMFGWVRVV